MKQPGVYSQSDADSSSQLSAGVPEQVADHEQPSCQPQVRSDEKLLQLRELPLHELELELQ